MKPDTNTRANQDPCDNCGTDPGRGPCEWCKGFRASGYQRCGSCGEALACLHCSRLQRGDPNTHLPHLTLTSSGLTMGDYSVDRSADRWVVGRRVAPGVYQTVLEFPFQSDGERLRALSAAVTTAKQLAATSAAVEDGK